MKKHLLDQQYKTGAQFGRAVAETYSVTGSSGVIMYFETQTKGTRSQER